MNLGVVAATRCIWVDQAGMGTKGTVASAVAMGVLLQEGVGDTIRVSLTPVPGESRTQEVVVASKSCRHWGLRHLCPV